MIEKRVGNDVFQDAYQDFFAKEKTTKEEGVPDGTAPNQGVAYAGELQRK